MASPYKVSKFQGGMKGAVYTCRCCGKKTRETGDGESSVELCKKCYYEGGLENEHQDGDHEPGTVDDCPLCQEFNRKKAEAQVKEQDEQIFNVNDLTGATFTGGMSVCGQVTIINLTTPDGKILMLKPMADGRGFTVDGKSLQVGGQ